MLEADVEESYGHFVRHFGKPAGFSSPGFYSDERVMRLLDRLGFAYNGDAHRRRAAPRHRGRPAAAALDHPGDAVRARAPFRSSSTTAPAARRRPRCCASSTEHLEGRDLVVLYGHPCYEGVREQRAAQGLRARCVERGFRFVTMQTLAERLQAARRAR